MKKLLLILLVLLFFSCKKNMIVNEVEIDTTSCEYILENFSCDNNFVKRTDSTIFETERLQVFNLVCKELDSCRLYHVYCNDNYLYDCDTIRSELFINDVIMWKFSDSIRCEVYCIAHLCGLHMRQNLSFFCHLWD